MQQLTFNFADIPQPNGYHEQRFFFISDQWIKLRYQTLTCYLANNGNHCPKCFRQFGPWLPPQVDHIRPRSKFPELALEPSNLQVLCRECNMAKGADNDNLDLKSAASG